MASQSGERQSVDGLDEHAMIDLFEFSFPQIFPSTGILHVCVAFSFLSFFLLQRAVVECLKKNLSFRSFNSRITIECCKIVQVIARLINNIAKRAIFKSVPL